MNQPNKTEIATKCEDFLKKEGLNDLVYVITLECSKCKALCEMKSIPYFKCPICKHMWVIKDIPLGVDKE